LHVLNLISRFKIPQFGLDLLQSRLTIKFSVLSSIAILFLIMGVMFILSCSETVPHLGLQDCTVKASTSSAGNYTVIITVYTLENNKIGNASAYLDNLFLGTTNSSGMLVVDHVPGGNHSLLVSMIGYQDNPVPLDLQQSNTLAPEYIRSIPVRLTPIVIPTPPIIIPTPPPFNSTPDDVPPILELYCSEENPSFSETVRFTANARDANGVQKIELFVEGSKVAESNSQECGYTGGPYKIGLLTYSARAWDTLGNVAETTKTVTVNSGLVSALSSEVLKEMRDVSDRVLIVKGTIEYQEGDALNNQGSFKNVRGVTVELRIEKERYLTQTDSRGAFTFTVPRIYGHQLLIRVLATNAVAKVEKVDNLPRVDITNLEGGIKTSGKVFWETPSYFLKRDDDWAHLAVGDVDGNADGLSEIVAIENTDMNRIFVYKYDRAMHDWDTFSGKHFVQRDDDWAHLALGDVDGDGIDEIIAAENTDMNRIFVYDYDGGTHSGDDFSGKHFVKGDHDWSNLSAGDVDGDGVDEIVATETGTHRIFVYKYDHASHDTDNFAGNCFVERNEDWAGLALGDLDGDGREEIVASENSGDDNSIFVYKYDGNSHTEDGIAQEYYVMRGEDWAHVATGDVNGDGADEIIAAENDGDGNTIFVYQYKTKQAFHNRDEFANNFFVKRDCDWAHLITADTNGDETKEIIAVENGGDQNSILIYKYDGRSHTDDEFSFKTYVERDDDWALVAAGDLTGDKKDEIVAIENVDFNRIFVYEIDNNGPLKVVKSGIVDYGVMKVGVDTTYQLNGYYYLWDRDSSVSFSSLGKGGGSVFFNIAETVLVEWEYARDNRAPTETDSISQVEVIYPTETLPGVPWTNPFSGEIYLVSAEDYGGYDTGFLDETILHEYAHFLTDQISENDWALSFSGHDDRSVIDEEFAWFEGFAEYMSAFLMNMHSSLTDPAYISQSLEYYSLIETPRQPQYEQAYESINGLLFPVGIRAWMSNASCEGIVRGILWDLVDDSTSAAYPHSNPSELFDTISNHDKAIFQIFDTEMDNDGWDADAPDIFEFIWGDIGWMNRFSGQVEATQLQAILNWNCIVQGPP
jgi:hypothetical protein